jgi:hypothetical protein
MLGPAILMVAGIIFLAASLFIIAFRIGTTDGLGTIHTIRPGFESMTIPEPLLALGALAYPSLPIGVMLFLIGLVNTTKKHSLRWLRITVSILCSILLGLAILWFLIILALLSSGF